MYADSSVKYFLLFRNVSSTLVNTVLKSEFTICLMLAEGAFYSGFSSIHE